MEEKKAWVDGFQEKFKDERYEDLLVHLKKFPVPKEFSLDTCYRHVLSLIDFMVLIENHADELKEQVNVESLKKGVKPGAILLDYIILEISTYFSHIISMKEEGKIFPDLPSYIDILRDYRNMGPAHRDKKHQLKTLADHTSNIKKLDSIGVPKIIEDFMNYHSLVKKNQNK